MCVTVGTGTSFASGKNKLAIYIHGSIYTDIYIYAHTHPPILVVYVQFLLKYLETFWMFLTKYAAVLNTLSREETVPVHGLGLLLF